MPKGPKGEKRPADVIGAAVKVMKIGARVARHGRYVTFQMAEIAISRRLFAEICD